MKRPCKDPIGEERKRQRGEEIEDVEMLLEVLSLDQAFDQLAERFAERLAVEDDTGSTMTYLQLQEASLRIASGMAKVCGKGEYPPVVAVLLKRSCSWLAVTLAAMRMGTLLALSCDLGNDDEETRNREAIVEHQPRLLVLERHGSVAPVSNVPVVYAEDLIQEVKPFEERRARHLDDALYLVYTGGTTAAAKCVVQTHRMALHELRTYPDFGVLTCEDRILHHTSAFWGATCLGLFDLAWSCGACLIILARHGVTEVARAIEERKVTVAGLVPSLLDALDQQRCTSLRTVFTWGEPLRPSTLESWRSRVQLLDLLIASEYWLVLCADHRHAGGFRPVRDARLTLLQMEDASQESVVEVAPGEVGELYIAGPMVSAKGYTKACLNEGAFVELPVGPGGSLLRHYRTRDLARFCVDGTLEYCGRADGFAKVGGKWLDLAAVERSLQAAGCREASLLWDEVAKVRHACVVPDAPQKSLASLANAWQALLPPQTRLHLLKELPKNAATGKVARGVLLKQLRMQEIPVSTAISSRICPISRSLALGLKLAQGCGARDGCLVPATLCLAPGLSELIWCGQCDGAPDPEPLTNRGGKLNGHSEKVANGAPLDHVVRPPLVPLGVAERLTSWLTWYRSISSILRLEDLELLPHICLLLLDGSLTGLEGLAKVLNGPMGILGGASFLCRWAPPYAKLLWTLAARRHAALHRGGVGWSWVFWLGFPNFADSWSSACWHSWPHGRPTSSNAWQALSGILKELQSSPTNGVKMAMPKAAKDCQELLRCTYCWDWVPEATCTIWRHKNYCSDCTSGWETYKQQRCAELGVETVSPAPTPDSTPYSTPLGTPTATPREASATNDAAKVEGPKKPVRGAVVTIDFADYELKLAQRQVPTTKCSELSKADVSGNGNLSKVAQVLERSTGLSAQDGLSGLESLKVIILVSALRRELGVNLAAGDVLQCSTLVELETLVAEACEGTNGSSRLKLEGDSESAGCYTIYAIPRFWKAPVGWLIRLDEIPQEHAMRIACRALVRHHVGLRAVPYRSLGDEATANLCMSSVQSLLIFRTLFGLEEVSSGQRGGLDAVAAEGLWNAWPRVETAPAKGGLPMCDPGGREEMAHFEWLSFESEADLRHAAWLKARSRGFRTPASMSVLFLPASASSSGEDCAYLQIAVNHAVTDAACIVPMVADLLEFHRAAKTLSEGSTDVEAGALAVLEKCQLPAVDGMAIAQERLQSALLGTKVSGWEERMDMLHNSCPPRKRGYDHYVKLTPAAGRVLEAAASVTGIPTDHLLVAALAAALGFAQKLTEVKLTLIVPMRDGPGHGQAVSNLASTRHLSVSTLQRSLFDVAFDLSSRFRRREWHTCQLLDDNGDRLFINLRGIPAFDGACPVIEPQDTTRKPTRFVRNIVEMFADQETLHSWTMWMGLREDVDANAFSRALRKALWGLATNPLSPLD